MRKIFAIITILVGLSICTYAQTGTPQDILKKANSDAKELEKAGWKPCFRMPEIKSQLIDVYLRKARIMNDGYPQYIIGYSRRRYKNFHGAHSMAMLAARGEIVKAIESYISSEIIIKIKTDIDSNTRQRIFRNVLVTSKRKLGITEPVVDIYRELKDGEFEVEVRVAYNKKEVENDINEVIKTVSK